MSAAGTTPVGEGADSVGEAHQGPLALSRRAMLATSLGALGAITCQSAAHHAPVIHGRLLDLPTPPREFRGVWVASVANIDWPSRPGLSATARRSEMARILDAAARTNLNAVFLQVRPSCDALYESRLEPWSEFLTGRQGTPPPGGGDPLTEWIEAAHARGLELHAWFNPFRARHFEAKTPNAANHVAYTLPDAWRQYAKYEWLDPGVTRARAHTLSVIADVVRRYPVDGVHLDDYFYPYPESNTPFPDDTSYARYQQSGGRLARADWRRANIDAFVREFYDTVKSIDPGVLVSLSPFGIWRPGHPPGIDGLDAYDKLAADARKWLREGWLDAAYPQLYWKTTSREQNFEKLLDWWIAQNVCPGLYMTRVTADGSGWAPGEILDQLALARSKPGSGGAVLFSAKGLLNNPLGVADAIARGPFRTAALVPESPWLRMPEPGDLRADAVVESSRVRVRLHTIDPRTIRLLVDAQYGNQWRSVIRPATVPALALDRSADGAQLVRVAVRPVSRGGRVGPAAVMDMP